jgi:K+-sensing histidine kinase KdpD
MTDAKATSNYQRTQLQIKLLQQQQAGISHDMKAPLGAVNSSAHILQKMGIVKEPEANKLLKLIMNCSKLLLFQVNDLVDQSLI